MIELAFTLAIVAAVGTLGWRRWKSRRLQQEAREQPGSSIDDPIYIRDFTEMDGHLRQRWCYCGGFQEQRGERTEEDAGRRFRVARLTCLDCEEEMQVWFETTDLLQ